MSDSQKEPSPQNTGYIDINDTYEMRNWCRELRCSEETLERVVRKVGNAASAVKRCLDRC